jgi:hypothetical protein
LRTQLELSTISGLARGAASTGLLLAASARASGALRSLDVAGSTVSHAVLTDVVAANAGALRELHVHTQGEIEPLLLAGVEALLRAAPGLTALDLHVLCTLREEALRVLRKEDTPALAPLLVRIFHRRL